MRLIVGPTAMRNGRARDASGLRLFFGTMTFVNSFADRCAEAIYGVDQ